MRDTFDKISREAAREGLSVGKSSIMTEDEKRKLIASLTQPTFSGEQNE